MAVVKVIEAFRDAPKAKSEIDDSDRSIRPAFTVGISLRESFESFHNEQLGRLEMAWEQKVV